MSTTFETDPSMLELFHIEAENHCKTMSKGILDLKSDPNNIDAVDSMMRAAQSLKGAAKLVNVVPAAELTLALEESARHQPEQTVFEAEPSGDGFSLNGKKIDPRV